MKTGTDFTDRNNIRAFVDAGNTNANEIGERLRIKPAVVQRYINHIAPPAPEAKLDPTPEPEGVDNDVVPAPNRRRGRTA